MARDLKRLWGTLTPGEEPELSASDGRLARVLDLSDHRSYGQAADAAEELFDAGVFDIRPISVWLFGAFYEGGVKVLADVLETCSRLMGEGGRVVGPTRRRDDQFAKRLSWLFETMTDALTYHAKKGTAEWQRWIEGLTPEAIDAAIAKGEALATPLSPSAFKQAHEALSRVIGFLRVDLEALRKPAAPPPQDDLPPPAPEPPRAAVAALDSLEPVRRRVELTVTHQFIDLWCKLKAFETLVERGELEKAALVADDLLGQLDSFDPRAYFPELFGRFSALMSRNINPLASHWSERDSPAWRAMAQHYRVDLKGFVEGS